MTIVYTDRLARSYEISATKWDIRHKDAISRNASSFVIESYRKSAIECRTNAERVRKLIAAGDMTPA